MQKTVSLWFLCEPLEDIWLNKVKRSCFQIILQPILKFSSEPKHQSLKKGFYTILEEIF